MKDIHEVILLIICFKQNRTKNEQKVGKIIGKLTSIKPVDIKLMNREKIIWKNTHRLTFGSGHFFLHIFDDYYLRAGVMFVGRSESECQKDNDCRVLRHITSDMVMSLEVTGRIELKMDDL